MKNNRPAKSRLAAKGRRVFRLTLWAAPALLTAAVILWGVAAFPRADAFRPSPDPENPGLSSFSVQQEQKLDRKQLDRLISEEKFEAAAKEAARLREEAKRTGDEAGWAWALIKEVQLRIALHGYETSVQFLKEEAWPKDPFQRDMLNLFYAQSLATYYDAYSWEINQIGRASCGKECRSRLSPYH